MAEREGFEPKRTIDGKTLNTAQKLVNRIRRDKNVNTRKIAGKISKTFNMGNRWATDWEGGKTSVDSGGFVFYSSPN
jgi:hypothetical protein